MRRLAFTLLILAAGILFLTTSPAEASSQHVWLVASPDHGQTFSYGSEQRRVWAERGSNHHLALLLDYTNDPYVDHDNPRQYDSFTFHFPAVKLGSDGHTFYYQTSDGRSVPVARRHSGFLGIPETELLPSTQLIVKARHGYLSLALLVEDHLLSSN